MHAQVIRRRMRSVHIVDLDDFTIVHAGDAVGVVKNAVVMSDDQNGSILATGDVLEEFHDDMAVFRIERRGGFIADDELRLMDEGAGDGDTLLLTARELRGPVMDSIL